MTREEIIAIANQAVTSAFESGAEFERKRLIEKACKWLEDTDFDMGYWNSEEGFCKSEFINDLRKVMEE